MNKESTQNIDTNSNGIAIQLLDHQINDLEYSTHYHNICCAGTMNYSGWYHDGDLYLLHLNKSSTTGANRLNVFNKLKNRTGVHALTWSEHYIQTILCGNHDGSINFWNVNRSKRLVSVQADKGYFVSAVDWNQLDHDYVLTASSSSRVKMFDISNLDYVSSAFTEHTRPVNDVKWNTNNKDEFATACDDGTLKIWDRRSSDQSSVNTLLDRTDPSGLKCLDWHKREDWLVGVGNKNGQVLLWDTRNFLQPIQKRYAHGSKTKHAAVNDIRFDTNDVQRFATCSDDSTTRIWQTSTDQQHQGIYLKQEHKIHRKAVNAVDWDIHNVDAITTAGSDQSLICCSLDKIVQVKEHQRDGRLVTEKQQTTTEHSVPPPPHRFKLSSL